MPHHPSLIWEHLSPDLQQRIKDDLSSILQEALDEYIRVSHPTASAKEGHHLHQAIHAASANLQSGELALTVRAEASAHNTSAGIPRTSRLLIVIWA